MRGSEKEKRAGQTALKNRYAAGAKLSEHKFLRLLHGYAHGTQFKALEPTTHVSGKTIRATYSVLRGGLRAALIQHPDQFGQAGRILMHASAPTLLHAVRQSRRFKRHRQHHAPRLACARAEDQFVTDKLVRLVCALDLRQLDLNDDDATGELIARLTDAIPQLHPREPRQRLADFVPGARPHAHPELRLYEDYRRYLLKNPLGT